MGNPAFVVDSPASGLRNEAEATATDPRESMGVLPRFLQPALTWLAGKPLPEQGTWKLKPVDHLVAAVVPLLVGVALAVIAVVAGGWWLLLLPAAWLLSTHGSRKLRSMILHECAHGNFLRRKKLDAAIGSAISFICFSQEYFDYKQTHVVGHHSSKHMTIQDPTVQYLIVGMKARAGMSRGRLWRGLCMTLVSPRFHARAMYRRFASHFKGRTNLYRASFALFLLGQIVVVTLTHIWVPFLLAWVFPLALLFNISVVLRVACEHVFPAAGDEIDKSDRMAGYTHGIFLGERVPQGHTSAPRSIVLWVRWWLRMLFVHLPARLFVLEGDGPCHDYHHRFPRSADWPNYIFARQQDVAAVAASPGAPPYTEVWGLFAAIDAVFVSLSKADPAAYDPRQLEAPNQLPLLEV